MVCQYINNIDIKFRNSRYEMMCCINEQILQSKLWSISLSCGFWLQRLDTKAIKTKLVVNICNQTFKYQKRQNTKSFKILETTCIVTHKSSLCSILTAQFLFCQYFTIASTLLIFHFIHKFGECIFSFLSKQRNADLFVHFSVNWFHGIFLAFSTISWAIFMPIVSFFCMASLRLFEELFNSLSDNWISSSATFLFFCCFLSTFHFLSFFYFQHYLLYFFFPLAL